MFRYERGFQPVTEIDRDHRLIIDLTLPPDVDSDQFEVRPRTLDHMARLAGFNTVRITTADSVENIADIEGKRPIFTSTVSYPPKERRPHYLSTIWPDLKIEIDRFAVQQKLEASGKPPNSLEGWAKELDATIKEGVLLEAHRHTLVGGEAVTRYDFVDTLAALTLTTATMGLLYLARQPEFFHVVPFAISLVTNAANTLYTRTGNYESQGNRWSLWPAFPFDRGILLNKISNSTIVRPKDNKKAS